MTTRDRRDHEPFDALEHTPDDRRAGEREIRQLLRQAGVHVVQMRHSQQRRKDDADEPAFLVRMNRVVSAGAPARQTGASPRRHAVKASNASSGSLANDGPILTPRTNGGRRLRNTRRPGIVTSCAERIGDQIDLWPSAVSALMRWNSLNGVPRGSKNGSGAIMRMRKIL